MNTRQINEKSAKLLLLSLGIGFLGYAIPELIGGTWLTTALATLLPGVIAAIVWLALADANDPADAGLWAGLLAGLGTLPARVVWAPAFEWFSLAEMVPQEYKVLFSMLPMPFVCALFGYLTGKLLGRFQR
jgi:hypothetical protein